MKRPNATVPKKSPQTNIRLPDGLRERLKSEAKLKGRSANTEIIMRLERSLDESEESTINALREYLEEEFADIRRELTKTRELILSKK